ncbi:MAG: PCMD domain-containing protein, partial [Bacteroidales bacterium]|nr:PCMD domain-containing protein [Bacteroidales bacterium]
MSIYIALTNWSEPYEIRTRPTNRQLFDKNDPSVIAYGEFTLGSSVEQWSDFTIDLQYRRTNEKPTHVVIVVSASKYGDFFTGGSGSTLWVDDFTLEWDY